MRKREGEGEGVREKEGEGEGVREKGGEIVFNGKSKGGEKEIKKWETYGDQEYDNHRRERVTESV